MPYVAERTKELTIAVMNKDGQERERVVMKYTKVLMVGQIRQNMAKRLGVEPDRICLTLREKVIMADFHSLKEYNLKEGEIVKCTVKPGKLPSIRKTS